MRRMIARRFLWGIFVMLVASIASFTLLYFAPGNPAENILRMRTGEEPSYEAIEMFMLRNNLGAPLLTQVTQWLYMALKFDFGTSINTSEPVVEEFFYRFAATVQLAIVSFVIASFIALTLGVASAANRNGPMDKICRFFALLGMSVPDFWIGLMMMIIFSRMLNLLPSFGYGSVRNMIMPVATLSISQTALMMRIIRTSVLDSLSQDFIVTARGNGLSKRTIMWRYALRHSLGPIVTAMGSQLGHLLTGTVVVETVFSWPGIGKFLVDAVYARDYPVIQGFVLIIALIFVIINLLTDILYAYIDPRIRYDKE
jgi:peptide/nickel transport system permease protein